MMRDFDAIVIGGGPAGAMAALHLAHMGWHIALIEKGARHRNKTCGHCLSPQAFDPLRRAGVFEQVRAIAAGWTNMFRVHTPNQRQLSAQLSAGQNSQGGFIVPRTEFDQLLRDFARRAGVVVYENASAQVDFRAGPGCLVRVRTQNDRFELRTRLVIGADGVGSSVARSAGLANHQSSGRKYGFSFDVQRNAPEELRPNAIEMFVNAGGYLGVVRTSHGHLHVAALVRNTSAAIRRNPLAFVQSIAMQHPSLAKLGFDQLRMNDIEQFAAVGPMPWRPSAVANRHAALIGDAAAYIDPFTGEGMSWALHSAETLAQTLRTTAPGNWNERLAREYASHWRIRFVRRHLRCRMIALGISHQPMTKLAMRAALLFPSVAQQIVDRVVAA